MNDYWSQAKRKYDQHFGRRYKDIKPYAISKLVDTLTGVKVNFPFMT